MWHWVGRGNKIPQTEQHLPFGLMLLRLGNVTTMCVCMCVCMCVYAFVCVRERGDVCSLVIKALECGLKDLLFQSHLQLLYYRKMLLSDAGVPA